VLFSLRLNNDLEIRDYVVLAREAERAGFDQLWVSNDLFLRGAWVILSAVAQATSSIRLGTCIVNPYTTHPAEIAMAATTLDELSNGRFNLGISAGAADFLGWVGLDAPRPLTMVRESVTVLRRLFSGERVEFDGRALRGWTREAYLRVPARPIPIYIGAMSQHMLSLIGEVADGGLPLLFPPEHLANVLPLIQSGAEKAGRSIEDVDVAACIWCSVGRDRDSAEAPLRDKIAYYGHALSPLILQQLGVTQAEMEPLREAVQVQRDPLRARAMVDDRMLRIGIAGTTADLIPRMEGLVAMGARHISFGPPLGPDPVDAVRLLGQDVLPRFR
jgi:5,10-methylenetetrahydromethanopterin reductase